MRKVIDSINNGQINRDFGTLTFSVSTVDICVSAGNTVEGSFSIIAPDGGLTYGYCLSSDYRMECISTEFSGSQDEIAYRFSAEKLAPGQFIRGAFYIISNRGEYQIPFSVQVESDVLETSMGPVSNIFHFTNLAKTKWEEALSVFYNPAFINLFTGTEKEYLAIYKCLSGITGSEYNMDEFLIAIRKKTPVEFIPSEKSVEINDPVDVSRFSVNISRNGWGYTHFSIEVEGDFLSVPQRDVYGDDFLGNNYPVYYFVDADKVHAGKNYGAIIIKDSRFETRIPVLVNANREGRHFKNMTMFRMRSICKIMEFYQSYRFKKISSRTWLLENSNIIEEMLANDPEDLLARLYQVHIQITQDRINEATWNLNKVKNQAFSVKEENRYLWCYYIYLSSLLDDGTELERYIEEVEYCFKLEPDNWRIAWLITFMSDEYKSATRKWTIYENAFEKGCNSPVIYLEAAKLVLENPAFIAKLGRFELQVIRYICKKGLLNDEIIFSIRTLAEHCKEYSEKLLKLLQFCYREMPHDELLIVICSQLIKGNRTDSDAFTWYSYGIRQELKITRLYEYYMMSTDKSEMKEIPRIVLMYFSFHSDLDYETNAYLYASVVQDKLKDPDMYSRYQMQIVDFVYNQLAAGHNNRYLAILYRNLIDDSMLVDIKVARQVADIIFMQEVDVSKYPDTRNVILCYEHHDKEKAYPVNDGKAIVPIYSADYCLALEDNDHNRMIATGKVEPVQLMPPGRLLLSLQLLLKSHTGLNVHFCMEHQLSAEVRTENEFRFRDLLENDYFSKEYANAVTMRLVRFYYEHERVEELDAFLNAIDSSSVAEFERAECVRFMVKRGLYDKAIKWIHDFGPEGVDSVVLSDLLYGWLPTHRIEADGYKSFVLQLLLSCLSSTKTNTTCMRYLMDNLEAPVQILRDVWKKAIELEEDCRDIEEKIIIQFLYSGAYLQEKSEIIKNYAYKVPDGDVLRAVLASLCYEFFVKEVIIPEGIFTVLADAFETDIELDKVCFLAYVKFYSENKEKIDDRIKNHLKDALHILLADDVVLACFKDLSDIMPSMSTYADLTVIEYRTAPATQVNIHYIIEAYNDDEYHTESMNEIYCGVYSKAFTLFFGEKLMYYITEDSGTQTDELSESNTIMSNDIVDDSSHGRFGVINDICVGRALHDYATVDELLEEYYRKDFMSSRLFGMHKG